MTIGSRLLADLPPAIAREVVGYTWQQERIGHSGADVYHLCHNGQGELYLKVVAGVGLGMLRGEAARLAWLEGKLPVPRLVRFEWGEKGAFLLVTAVAGVNVTRFNDESDVVKDRAVRLLAQGLHAVHSVPIAGCPFDQTLAVKMSAARRRVAAGLVDEMDFDRERLGRTAVDLFRELRQSRPPDEDLVFTHGDYCLPNILVKDGRVSGFVDWGQAGIADRYQDLALCARSLCFNFGAGWGERFLGYYGVQPPNEAKLTFYQLLDEFF